MVPPTPIKIETPTLLDFPKICMRCGVPTNHTIKILPPDPDLIRTEHLLGCAAGLAPIFFIPAAVIEFRKKKTRIPLCKRCHCRRILPDPKLTFSIFLFFIALAAMIWSTFYDDSRHIFIYGGLALVLVISIQWRNEAHETESFPVEVFDLGDRFQYIIHGGPIHDYFRKSPHPAIVRGEKRSHQSEGIV